MKSRYTIKIPSQNMKIVYLTNGLILLNWFLNLLRLMF